jgi:hypothetical protein
MANVFVLITGVAAIMLASLSPIAQSGVYAETPVDQPKNCQDPSSCKPTSPSPTMGPELPSSADSASAPSSKSPNDDKRWSSFLPLMAEEATKRGHQLPLPFGISTVVTGLFNRQITVTDVRVGINGAAQTSVGQVLNLGSTSNVVNANLKLDAWILPFLNVYILAGYVYNESTTRATLTVPRPGSLPGNVTFTTSLLTTLNGFVGGGGMTLAGGYKNFFLVADANYSQTDIGFDDSFKALIATARAGYRSQVGSLPLQLWIGEGFWNTTNTAKGHTFVPGVGRIDFEADQGPKHPWMTDFGTNLSFAKWFDTVLDFGTDWHGGYLMVVAPTVRF